MSKPTMQVLRNQAIDRRNAIHAAINEKYERASREEDAAFDLEHDKARDEYERIRKRPRPDHSAFKRKRDEELAEADKKLDAELNALFLQNGVTDSGYN